MVKSTLSLVLFVQALLTFRAQPSFFDSGDATFSAYLSAAAYCDEDTYKTKIFKGETAGFVVTKVINSEDTDTVGFIGFSNYMKKIYVVYRGSVSIENWLADMSYDQVRYTSYPRCDCYVHSGFYRAEQSVINEVVAEVLRLRNITGYDIGITGHSLGR